MAHHSNMANSSAWTPAKNPSSVSVEATFDEAKLIKRISTEGWPCSEALEYVTSYTLMFLPGMNHSWRYITDTSGNPRLFEGNVDNYTTKTNTLEKAVRAFGIRLIPKGFVGATALRWDVFEEMREFKSS